VRSAVLAVMFGFVLSQVGCDSNPGGPSAPSASSVPPGTTAPAAGLPPVPPQKGPEAPKKGPAKGAAPVGPD
jgi:hypothetical protein